MNKLCNNVTVVLSNNDIDCVHETKYLGVMLSSSVNTSIAVARQTRKFYKQVNSLLHKFRYCTADVKCMFSVNLHC